MSNISVADGWQHILTEAVEEASKLPEEWLFEIVSAERVDGALKLSATYITGDITLDDHLPADRKLPHPFRAFLRIRETARAKSLVTCECCGRGGKLFGSGDEARVRCAAHEGVVDAAEWSANPVGFLFESAEEAMTHFVRDYGGGLDMMQELQAEGLLDSKREDDDDTQH